MIIRQRLSWFRMLMVWHGSVLPRIIPQLILTTTVSLLVLLTHPLWAHWKITLTVVPFTLIGVGLSVFLAFRNNASYERFWEGRKLWGMLLNDSRSLAREVLTFYDGPRSEARTFIYMLIAEVHALRHQLRETDGSTELAELLPTHLYGRIIGVRFKPAMLVLAMGEWLQAASRAGHISDILLQNMDRKLNGITDIIGGCERIVSTPIPFAYTVLLHRTVYLFCFLLPFGLVDSIGAMSLLVVAFVSYTFFALDAISEEIEEPFGTKPNDLALEAMSRAIESSLREMLGEKPLQEVIPHRNSYILL